MALNKTIYYNEVLQECWLYDADRDVFFNVETFEWMHPEEFFVYWDNAIRF